MFLKWYPALTTIKQSRLTVGRWELSGWSTPKAFEALSNALNIVVIYHKCHPIFLHPITPSHQELSSHCQSKWVSNIDTSWSAWQQLHLALSMPTTLYTSSAKFSLVQLHLLSILISRMKQLLVKLVHQKHFPILPHYEAIFLKQCWH